jgi:hypothetical protein
VPYFSGHKVNQLFNAFDIERKILFPCLYGSLKERDHVKSRTSSSPKLFLSTQRAMNLEGMHLNLQKKCTNNYENDKRSCFPQILKCSMLQ